MSNVHPKLLIFVVYQSKNGNWRGFCSPYDVTTEAKTSAEATKQLEDQVKLYNEGLKKYNYPDQLTIKELSDPEDKVVFKIALKEVLSDFKKKILDEYLKFQAKKEKEEISLERNTLLINYSQFCFA